MKDLALERRHVKLLLPAVGVLAGYVGAFLAAWLIFWVTKRAWLAGPVAWLGFLVAALAAMTPVDSALGEKASHVDLLKVLVWWTGAALALVALHWLLSAALHAGVSPFVDNLVLWGTGATAIWRDERATAPERSSPPRS